MSSSRRGNELHKTLEQSIGSCPNSVVKVLSSGPTKANIRLDQSLMYRLGIAGGPSEGLARGIGPLAKKRCCTRRCSGGRRSRTWRRNTDSLAGPMSATLCSCTERTASRKKWHVSEIAQPVRPPSTHASKKTHVQSSTGRRSIALASQASSPVDTAVRASPTRQPTCNCFVMINTNTVHPSIPNVVTGCSKCRVRGPGQAFSTRITFSADATTRTHSTLACCTTRRCR